MCQHDGACACGDSWREYLASLNGHVGNRAHRNGLEGDRAEPDIQEQDSKGLAIEGPQRA
jgi:hypothetical protein